MPITVPQAKRSLPRTLSYVIGSALTALGAIMLAPAALSLSNREWATAGAMAGASAVTMAVGFLLWRWLGRTGAIGMKEGFASVGLTWFVICLFGTLPYLFSGHIPGITDAFFETVSGFTTTGATVFEAPEQLPRGVLLWRGLTQWLGAMGVIILSVAILPLLGTGGMQLARAEFPGGAPERLTPRFQETAKRLWLLYAALTALCALMLSLGDMDWFEALVHALTTLSTGGFSTEGSSIAAFSAYTQWLLILFMFVGGTSFVLHFRALAHPGRYWRSTEFRLYAGLTVAAVAIVTGGLLRDSATLDALRGGTFTVVSIITTTGFVTADFDTWSPALRILLVALMFLGGMAGSTAGSVKTFRIGILSKAAFTDLRRLVYPRGIFTLRFGKDRVPDPIVESVQSFFLFYMFLFMTGTFLLTFVDANLLERLDLVTAASAVAASLGNIGPGLGDVGPVPNYSAIPDPGKWLLAGLMIVGRLEIFPVLVLFTRHLWRR